MSAAKQTITMTGTVRIEGDAYSMGVQLARHYCGPVIDGVLAAVEPPKRPLLLAGLITEICIQAEGVVGTPFMLDMLRKLVEVGCAVEPAEVPGRAAPRSH